MRGREPVCFVQCPINDWKVGTVWDVSQTEIFCI